MYLYGCKSWKFNISIPKKIIRPFDIFKKAITEIFGQLLRHEHIQLQFNHKFTSRRWKIVCVKAWNSTSLKRNSVLLKLYLCLMCLHHKIPQIRIFDFKNILLFRKNKHSKPQFLTITFSKVASLMVFKCIATPI